MTTTTKRLVVLASVLALTLTACADSVPDGSEVTAPDAENTVVLGDNDDYPAAIVYIVPKTITLKDGRKLDCLVSVSPDRRAGSGLSCDWSNAK